MARAESAPRAPRGQADCLRRRPGRCRTDALTSRFSSACDDRGVRSDPGRDPDPSRPGARCRHHLRPPVTVTRHPLRAFPISGQAAERHSGRFSGDLFRIGRSHLAADAAGQPEHFIPVSINADGRAPLLPNRNCVAARPGPGRAARAPGDHPRLLPAIYRGTVVISGHDRPCLPRLAASGLPLEHGTYRTGAGPGMRPYRGLMILIARCPRGCQGSVGRIPRAGQFTDLVNFPWPGVNSASAAGSAIGSPPGGQRTPRQGFKREP